MRKVLKFKRLRSLKLKYNRGEGQLIICPFLEVPNTFQDDEIIGANTLLFQNPET